MLGVGILAVLGGVTEIDERILTAIAFSMWMVVVVLLSRRFRRLAPEGPTPATPLRQLP